MDRSLWDRWTTRLVVLVASLGVALLAFPTLGVSVWETLVLWSATVGFVSSAESVVRGPRGRRKKQEEKEQRELEEYRERLRRLTG